MDGSQVGVPGRGKDHGRSKATREPGGGEEPTTRPENGDDASPSGSSLVLAHAAPEIATSFPLLNRPDRRTSMENALDRRVHSDGLPVGGRVFGPCTWSVTFRKEAEEKASRDRGVAR